MAFFEGNNMTAGYGNGPDIISSCSITANRGEIVAILGPNGAGKSTTMKMLTGYLAPSAGSARVCGMEVAGNRDAVANRIGYLPENGPLYEEMTPLTLLNFFGDARSLDADYKSKRISEVTEQCALETVLNKPIGKLSRGLANWFNVTGSFFLKISSKWFSNPSSNKST